MSLIVYLFLSVLSFNVPIRMIKALLGADRDLVLKQLRGSSHYTRHEILVMSEGSAHSYNSISRPIQSSPDGLSLFSLAGACTYCPTYTSFQFVFLALLLAFTVLSQSYL